jgi:hypothetical protein
VAPSPADADPLELMEHGPITCEDCYFRRELLCALQVDEPCPTFRPASRRGLVPPRQAQLVAPVNVAATGASLAR